MNENSDIPFQIQRLIDDMNNKRETDHIRNNYRMRLDSIKKAIDKALISFDNEMGRNVFTKSKREYR